MQWTQGSKADNIDWRVVMNNNLLEIKNLEVVYVADDSVARAVNGIDLELCEGETLGIVGETGAGKTTTALSILRILPNPAGQIKNGEIVFMGKNLLELSESEMTRVRGSEISMIFQDPMTSLNPVITVGDQIAEALFLHNDENMTKVEIDLKVSELLELVGISAERKIDYPHQFSGGMKQRVVIAMALACNPKLVIADEPTTALDVTIQAQVLKMMYELKKKTGTSMILITHDLGIVAQICDKVAVMYSGEIVESGTVYDLFEGERHHPYTKGLFSSIPLLEEKCKRLQPIMGMMPDPLDLPKGCKFEPRCEYATQKCKSRIPNNVRIKSHLIKCNLFDGGSWDE